VAQISDSAARSLLDLTPHRSEMYLRSPCCTRLPFEAKGYLIGDGGTTTSSRCTNCGLLDVQCTWNDEPRVRDKSYRRLGIELIVCA
jgi:hypothetical protein